MMPPFPGAPPYIGRPDMRPAQGPPMPPPDMDSRATPLAGRKPLGLKERSKPLDNHDEQVTANSTIFGQAKPNDSSKMYQDVEFK